METDISEASSIDEEEESKKVKWFWRCEDRLIVEKVGDIGRGYWLGYKFE